MKCRGSKKQHTAGVLLLLSVVIVTSVSAECGGTFTTLKGSIQSPNFPASYSNNLNCRYLVSVPPGNRITLTFHAFQLQDRGANGDCRDVIQIYDGSSDQSHVLRTLCGQIDQYNQTRTTQNQMLIRFASDNANSFSGFNASYETDTQGDYFALLIDSTNNYVKWVDLTTVTSMTIPVYVISPIAVEYGSLDRRVFFIQKDDSRIYSVFLNGTDRKTVITLGQGVVLSDIAVDGTYRSIFYLDTGNDVVGVVTTSGADHKRLTSTGIRGQQHGELALDTKMRMVFWTKGNSVQRVNYDGTDHRTLTELSQSTTLLSIAVDSPNGYLYVLHKDVNGRSIIESYDLNGSSQTVIFNLAGNQSIFQIYYFNNLIHFLYRQANSGDIQDKVYTFERSKPTAERRLGVPFHIGDIVMYKESANSGECGGTFTALNGNIQSPNFPASYSNNLDCRYLVSVPQGYRITLTFHDFQLQGRGANGDCQDVVQIYDGSSDRSPVLRTLCGQIDQYNQTRTTQNQILIQFTSDSADTFSGFSASYTTDTLGDYFALLIDSSKDYLKWADLMTATSTTIPVYVNSPTAVEYGFLDRRVYFIQKDDSRIYSVFLNGTDRRTVINFGQGVVLSDIAVDATSRIIFYLDSEKDVIGVVTTSGTMHKRVISTGIQQPGEIALDTKTGMVFWTNSNSVQRVNYDGTDQRTVTELSQSTTLLSIAVDSPNGYLYVLHKDDNGKSVIESYDLNGSSRTVIFNLAGNHTLFQIYCFENQIYFLYRIENSTDYIQDKVYAFERSRPIAERRLGTPFHIGDIAMYKESKNRELSKCEVFNGGCDHICIPTPDNRVKCLCSDGNILDRNNRTCKHSNDVLPSV